MRTWTSAFKGWWLGLVVATSALAVPPVPSTSAPVDGGWTQKAAELDGKILPRIPSDVPAFEFETHAPQGTVTWSAIVRKGTSASVITATSAPLPDAGVHFWRVRAIDDAGVVSAWSAFESFRVDDAPPPDIASFTVAVDGGFVDLACSPVTDPQSGLGRYHFLLSDLDPPDGSVLSSTNTVGPSYFTPGPSAQLVVGPGRWLFAVHAHDAVDNIPAQALNAGPIDVPVSALVPVPSAPVPVRGDGGAYARFPYLNTDSPRFAWASDGGTAFVLVSRAEDGGPWSLIGAGPGPTVVTTNMAEGPQDVRVARVDPTAVSDWSSTVRVWIDVSDPLTPVPTARVDAGVVSVSWARVRDRYSTSSGSGVADYRVSRCCTPDGSVSLGSVADVPDASFVVQETPAPGSWTWSVVAVDLAGNFGTAGTASLALPPPVPTLRTSTPVTAGPVSLAWDDVADGGFVVSYELRRGDLDGGVEDAGVALLATSAQVSTPEGAWVFSVRAVTDGVPSAWSPSVPVLVDQTPPLVSDVLARRLDARTLRLEWTASDALAGLGSELIERDTGGVTSTLDAGTSPLVDAPPDGVHRYRVIAVDLAGNSSSSAWSAPIQTPGSTVAITPVPEGTVQCGRELSLQLQATGDPVTRWSLVEPVLPGASIDEATGLLRYRPTSSDVGVQTVLVRAESTTSLDEEAVTVDVTCTPDRYGVHCGCAAGDGGLALLGLVLLLRRRARR